MIIYLDNDFKCHTSNDGTLTEAETDFFNGKSKAFIEGYRFIPNGYEWQSEGGEVFTGEMVAPWRDYTVLEELQTQYDELQAQLADAVSALELLGVEE